MKFLRRWASWLFLAAVFGFHLWDGGTVLSFLPFLSVGLFFGLAVLPSSLKANFLKALEGDFVPASLAEFPKLDAAQLENLTAQWQEFGFAPCRDLKLGSDPKLGTGFIRLMANTESGILAEISQIFLPNGKVAPMSCTLASYFGDQSETAKAAQTAPAPIASPSSEAPAPALPGYYYGTTNRAANWLLNVFSHPTLMGTRFTGATPDVLLAIHLDRRAAIARALGQEPARDNLLWRYETNARLQKRVFRHQIERRAAWPMFWRALRQGTKTREYFGELAVGELKLLEEFLEKP